MVGRAKPAATRGRLCVVTSNFPRWAGDSTTPFVLHLAEDLQDLGWTVDVIAPHASGAARHEVLHGVRVDRFRYWWPAAAQTVCYGGGALINLRHERSNWLKLPALVAAEWGAVLRRLATGGYDLLHSHWVLPQGFVGVLAARPLGVPHVVTVHGGDVFGLGGPTFGAFKRFAFEGASAVTVNSSVTEAAVRELAPGVARLDRIPMGITEPAAMPGNHRQSIRARHRRGNGPLLVFVGRLVEEKGVDDLVRAVDRLSTSLPDVTALIVGDGQDRLRMEALAARLGVADRVAFTGWVEPGEVPEYMAAGDVFVGPSKRAADGWVEAQGLTFAEAMLAGVPVVATRSGGIPDVVQDDHTGLLVPEASPGDIAQAVVRLVAKPELAGRLADAGRALAGAHFTRAASARSFSGLFDDLLGGRRPR